MTDEEFTVQLQDLLGENHSEINAISEQVEKDEKQEFETHLLKTIEKGDVNKITDKLTPRALTKCKTNALLMALKVNSKLCRLADRKGPDEAELRKLANSVEEFTTCLLDPLRSNTVVRHTLEDSLDEILDLAIDLEQKTILIHPVLYNMMSRKWYGEFSALKRSDWLSLQHVKWLFLNIWCLFDLFFFPILFAVFYIIHFFREKARMNKEREIAFVLYAASKVGDQAFGLMKDTVRYTIKRHSQCQCNFRVIITGEDRLMRQICPKTGSSEINKLMESVDTLKRGVHNKPALHEDLQRAKETFTSRKKAEKFVVLFTDQKAHSKRDKEIAKHQVKAIKKLGARLLPIGLGPHVNLRELGKIQSHTGNVIHFGEYEDYRKVGKRIFYEIEGKDVFESYLEYFTTPYFVFVRDTLSYLALLGLHFALCLAPSSIAFSGVEWAILLFFVGRVVMESEQFAAVKLRRGKGGSQGHRQSKDMTLYDGQELQTEESTSTGKARTEFFNRFRKYLSDRWNVLDFITLIIYFTTFMLRMVTWKFSDSVANNRSLVIAGYFYGLITLFLTLRAFGHIMEATKGIGSIQIALFRILFDVVAILGQFVATILAFAYAMTKIVVAEMSYMPEDPRRKDSWLKIAEHFCWSLLGMPDRERLMVVGDTVGTFISSILYGLFLVMGVVFIVNMMIALLSNTYQRVQDNSLKEWTFKKAITIHSYCGLHPIPVPWNLISNLTMGLGQLYGKCTTRCKRPLQNQREVIQEKRPNLALDSAVKSLQFAYIATYGYSFPLTDERKMDHVLQQTEQSRQMANQVMHLTFASHDYNRSVLPTGPEAWDGKGITVNGCLLTNEGSELCGSCGDHPSEVHGARYIVPFSREYPHLEVLILETGEWRIVGVGVVCEDYDCHDMPGSRIGAVGYHTDEGKIFDANTTNDALGKEIEDAMAYRGDVVGCTVKFKEAAAGKVPVVFTLNGRTINQGNILMEYNPEEKLYPYIGMGSKGIRVLAKLCSTGGYNDDRVTMFSSRDSHTGNRRPITWVMSDLIGNIESKFDVVDKNAAFFDQELTKAGEKLEFLRKGIFENFGILHEALQFEGVKIGEDGTRGSVPLASEEETTADFAPLQENEHSEATRTTDEGHEKALNGCLVELELIISDRFGSVFKALDETQRKVTEHAQKQEKLRKEVNKRFHDLLELIMYGKRRPQFLVV